MSALAVIFALIGAAIGIYIQGRVERRAKTAITVTSYDAAKGTMGGAGWPVDGQSVYWTFDNGQTYLWFTLRSVHRADGMWWAYAVPTATPHHPMLAA